MPDKSQRSLLYRVYFRARGVGLVGDDFEGVKFAQAFGFPDYVALYNVVERGDEALNRKLLALDNDNIVCLWKAMQARSGSR